MTEAYGQPQYQGPPQQQYGPPAGQPAYGQPQYQQPGGFPMPAQGQPAYGGPPVPAAPEAPSVGELLGGGGGIGGPAFKFLFDKATGQGNGLIGEILAVKAVPKTDPFSTVQKFDAKGRPLWQIAVTLQTALRDWAGLKKVPVDTINGQQVERHPSQDTGVRNVYLWYTSREAAEEAVKAAGRDPKDGLEVGAVFGLQVVGVDPNPKGGDGDKGDIKKYRAVYYPPGSVPPEVAARIGAAPAPQQPQYQAPAQQPQYQAPAQQPQYQAPAQQPQYQPGPQELGGQPNPFAAPPLAGPPPGTFAGPPVDQPPF